MTDIDSRIRTAYGPVELAPESLEHGWDDLLLERSVDRSPARRRRAGARAPRVLVAIAVLVVSVSSIAIAQTGAVRDLISGGSDDRPADRMEVLTQPAEASPSHDAVARTFGERPQLGGTTFETEDLRPALLYRRHGLVVRIMVAPSQDGQPCMYVANAGHYAGITCAGGFRFNGHVSVTTMGDLRTGTLVLGLIDDRVRRVRVKFSDGRVVPAVIGRNAYLLHERDFRTKTRGLLVDLKDGTTLDVAMNGCLRSQLVPPPKSRLGCGYGMNKGPS